MNIEGMKMSSNEIGLKDIFCFLKRNQRAIVIFFVMGLLFQAAYLLLTPNKYEARWQIQMAQLVNNLNNLNNIEEPAELSQRLRSISAYPGEVLQSCGVSENKAFGEYLGGVLRVEIIRNVANSVEMKVVANSPDLAKRCADSLVAMIVAQQRNLLEEHMSVRESLLIELRQVLHREQVQIETLKSNEMGSFKHFAKLSRVNSLLMRIDALQEEILMSQKYPTKLLSPVYVASKPVSPKWGVVFLLGGILSFLLGVIYSLVRTEWRKAT
jgi:LPS O-antigen subunit length determinant protein (WzzB/FepE family)